MFFNANEDCICELHWRNNKGSLLRGENFPFDKFEEFPGYRTFRVGFNADGASVYRASLAFIFFEKIYKGGQNVLVKSLKTLANTGEIGFYFFIRT